MNKKQTECEELTERIQECKRYDRCSFSICPLDPEGKGCYVEGEPTCPLVKPDSEDKETPFRKAIRENRDTRKNLNRGKSLSREITINKELRGCHRDKTPQITRGKVVLRETVEVGHSKPQQVRLLF